MISSLYARAPLWLQELGMSAYGAMWRWRRFGPGFEEALRAAKEREQFTAAQWQEYQTRQLREVLVAAIRYVPWYRERYTASGFTEKQLARFTLA
ncbi:MAG: hypothetical protein AB1664_19940, partial [Thermodesulfobacteriota bacterium]